MWQNILVILIVAVTAALVARSFYRKLTGKSSGCGGCSAAGSQCCGSGGSASRKASPSGTPSGAPLRPLNHSGCGCGR